MKRSFLALFAVAIVASVCFAEEASSPTATPSNAVVSALLSGNTAPLASVGTTTLTGKIASVTGGSGISGVKPQISVEDDKGQRTTFIVASDATIIGRDGNPTTLNWIGDGDKVSIDYITNQDGTKTAKSIKLSSTW